MNVVDLTNQITRCEALIEQYKNSELYAEHDKEKRIQALKIEIVTYQNRLKAVQSKNNSTDINFKTTY
ncbi:MAG TPA: hypothetical protein P5188_11065 [Flavobacterium sp.]|nr:hypothetical protein [Flavobacterium sp.]